MSQSNNTIEADPMDSRLFTGTISRRIFAFLIDYVIVLIAIVMASIVVGFVGILTFGLGFLLYFVLAPLIIFPYIALTLGGPDQATPGMKAMSIALSRDDGKPIDWVMAIIYCVIFWASVSVLTPFILLIALFTNRKRTLHDILLGTAVVRR